MTLHYTALHYTTLHYTTLHYTTLHYTTLHYTTLHYTTLTLHYTTLHCITHDCEKWYFTPFSTTAWIRAVFSVIPVLVISVTARTQAPDINIIDRVSSAIDHYKLHILYVNIIRSCSQVNAIVP